MKKSRPFTEGEPTTDGMVKGECPIFDNGKVRIKGRSWEEFKTSWGVEPYRLESPRRPKDDPVTL